MSTEKKHTTFLVRIWPEGKYLSRLGQVANLFPPGWVMRRYIRTMHFPVGHEFYEQHQTYLREEERKKR